MKKKVHKKSTKKKSTKRREPSAPKAKSGSSGSETQAVDFKLISSVAKHSELLDVALVEFGAAAESHPESSDFEGLTQVLSYRSRLGDERPEGVIPALVEFKYDALEAGKTIAKTSGLFLVVYEAKPSDELPEAAIEMFARVNGVYSAWPFMRELVSSNLTRLGFGRVLLPVWKPPAAMPTDVEEYLKLVRNPTDQD